MRRRREACVRGRARRARRLVSGPRVGARNSDVRICRHVCYPRPPVGRGRTRSLRFALAGALVVLLAGVFVASAMALRSTTQAAATRFLSMQAGRGRRRHALPAQADAARAETAPPYSYSLKGGALPPGTSLNVDSGLISGIPRRRGLRTSESSSATTTSYCHGRGPRRRMCPAGRSRSPSCPAISINNQSVASGTSVRRTPCSLAATNVTTLNPPTGPPAANATWSLSSGPAPSRFDCSARTGVLSGTPTGEGAYQFVVRASLDPSRFDTETLSITVRQALTIRHRGRSPRRVV